MKILLVEDNEQLRFLFSEQLKKFGLEADYAWDGLEALKKLCDVYNSYDVVFMDLNLPMHTGFEVAEKFRERRPEYKTRIYAFSGSQSPTIGEAAVKAGMQGCFQKPFSLDELKAILIETRVLTWWKEKEDV